MFLALCSVPNEDGGKMLKYLCRVLLLWIVLNSEVYFILRAFWYRFMSFIRVRRSNYALSVILITIQWTSFESALPFSKLEHCLYHKNEVLLWLVPLTLKARDVKHQLAWELGCVHILKDIGCSSVHPDGFGKVWGIADVLEHICPFYSLHTSLLILEGMCWYSSSLWFISNSTLSQEKALARTMLRNS